MMYWRRSVSDLWGREVTGGVVNDREDRAGTARGEAAEETGYRPRN
ncbi:NUDIX hydrolase, partial [Streptomyces rubellomurinus subsp. indigoferus]